jgi:ribosomal protein S18 acetylase RimI-like enzyme
MTAFEIAPAPDPDDAAILVEDRLAAALRANVPPNDAQPLALLARDAERDLVGGLIGSTSYGWLLVKMLWVDERARGRRLGQELMQAAEREAVRRGCHGAWLDTSSAAAARFYERLGYRTFGTLENRPDDRPVGHRRWFMRKRLLPTEA